MNKLLQEALWRQRVRRMHKKVIKHSGVLKEAQANLYTTFVEPFTDIIDAAKLTGQDILNAVSLQFDLLFTLGTKGMDEALEKYDKRKAAIGKKWEPLMKRNAEALESGDADLIALVLAPQFYLTQAGATKAYEGADSFYDYMDESGWKIPLVGALFGDDEKKPSGGGDDDDDDDKGKGGQEKSLLQKLAGLFYFEGAWLEGDLILEQEEQAEQEDKKKPPLDQEIAKYFKETGLGDKFAADAKELMKGQEEMIQKVLDEALPRLVLISVLTNTADVDEFIAAIDKAEQGGLDLESAGMDKVRTEVENSANKLAQSKEFREKAAETAGVAAEKMSDDDALNAAKKVAFTNAKQAFDEQAQTGKEKLRKEALALLEEKSPAEEHAAALKSSKEGIALLKLIEDAKQKITDA